ncbi:MAG: hypothetical protein ACTSYJ_11680 [Candidatus Thorarchaeota archaeon]
MDEHVARISRIETSVVNFIYQESFSMASSCTHCSPMDNPHD